MEILENKLEYTPISGKFKYGVISNIVTPQENSELVDIIEKYCIPIQESIESKEFFKFSDEYIASNKWIHPEGELGERWGEVRESIIKRLKSPTITDYYTPLLRQDMNRMQWTIGLTVSSGIKLLPHNDDPIEARNNMADKTIPVTSGIYKGVIYLGYPNIDYSGYGTRFYERVDNDNYNELVEIPFVPGTACIFEADSYSYHGTEYTSFNHPRYTITLEYF